MVVIAKWDGRRVHRRLCQVERVIRVEKKASQFGVFLKSFIHTTFVFIGIFISVILSERSFFLKTQNKFNVERNELDSWESKEYGIQICTYRNSYTIGRLYWDLRSAMHYCSLYLECRYSNSLILNIFPNAQKVQKSSFVDSQWKVRDLRKKLKNGFVFL